MNRIILLFIGYTACCLSGYGQSYPASAIPEKLKEGAHAVKRFEEISFVVTDIDNATLRVHQVYTVLDKQGDAYLSFAESESKFMKLKDVEIKGYNANGVQVKRYKKKDLYKQMSVDGLVADYAFYKLNLSSTSYPATIEIEYEFNYSGTLFYPAYDIMKTDESVEHSSFTVKVPADLGLRYKAQKTDIEPVVTQDGKFSLYKWEANNLKALPKEEESVSAEFYSPRIVLAPNKFRLYNTTGDLSSWKSFGEWSYKLYDGLDELPEDRITFFRNMVKHASSDREKAAILYKYLQDNFRYVSIQLRIGGWKPFPAKFTDEQKYGDCKGLSFYMHTMLKAVGVKSYLALVNAEYNKQRVAADFPAQQFNHVIVCVPQPGDSIWLDCTMNHNDFDVLGTFTENKNALLVTENGGVLVSTPSSESAANVLIASTEIKLNEDGSGISHTATYSKGELTTVMRYMYNANKDDQKRVLVNYLGFKQPDAFRLTQASNAHDYNVDVDLSIEKIPQFTAGSKMFLNPRIYSIWQSKLPKAEGRTQDFYFRAPFIKIDTTRYHLPQDFTVDILPKPASLQCDYASYKTEYVFDENKGEVVCLARLELKQNRIPASKYADIKSFFDKVLSEETQKVIIKRD